LHAYQPDSLNQGDYLWEKAVKKRTTSNPSSAVQKIYFYHTEFKTLTSSHVGTWKGLGTGWKASVLSSRNSLSACRLDSWLIKTVERVTLVELVELVNQ